MRILITGARGFLGFSFAELAVSEGHQVLGVGRSAQPPIGWPGQYAWADVAQTDLAPIIDGYEPDLLFHAAGAASVGASFHSPLDDLRASVLTFANTLEGVRRSRNRPVVIFPSSAAVYGNPSRLPISEGDPVSPISPYGFHKLAAEQVGREYAACHGLRVIVGRIFSVVGVRQRRLLLWELFEQFSSNSPEVVLQGTGNETRDFLHVDAVARIFLSIGKMVRDDSNETEFLTVNVASGVETSVRALVDLLGRLLSCEKVVRYKTSQRLGDPQRWRADLSKLSTLLDLSILPTLDQAISEVLSGWRVG